MTATETPTIQAESSPPSAPSPAPRRRRRVLLGRGTCCPRRHRAHRMAACDELRDPNAPSCARVGRSTTAASGSAAQASAGSNAGDVQSSDAYAQFCQNSPVLCSPAAPPAPNAGYVQFCHNSPALCTVAKPN